MNENKKLLSMLIVVALVAFGALSYLNYSPTTKTENEYVAPIDQSSGINSLIMGPVVGTMKSAELGEYLTDNNGMTLYIYSGDKKLESTCTGDCLTKWPIFEYDNKDLESFSKNDSLSRTLNLVKRKDGLYQYAYIESPLYYYAEDENPGDVKGDGLGDGKWSVVKISQ